MPSRRNFLRQLHPNRPLPFRNRIRSGKFSVNQQPTNQHTSWPNPAHSRNPPPTYNRSLPAPHSPSSLRRRRIMGPGIHPWRRPSATMTPSQRSGNPPPRKPGANPILAPSLTDPQRKQIDELNRQKIEAAALKGSMELLSGLLSPIVTDQYITQNIGLAEVPSGILATGVHLREPHHPLRRFGRQVQGNPQDGSRGTPHPAQRQTCLSSPRTFAMPPASPSKWRRSR